MLRYGFSATNHLIFYLILLDLLLEFHDGSFANLLQISSHPKYQNTRCFELVRMDGTVEDFSYHKCVLGALEMIDPRRAKGYKSKWLQNSNV